MPRSDILTLVVYFITLLALAYPLGHVIASVLSGNVPKFLIFLKPLERIGVRLSGIDPAIDQKAKSYLKDLLLFNLIGLLFLFALLLFQSPSLSWDLAFNTAASFVTNTNWQAYSGESALTNLSQMLGLGVQNFLSASTGLALVAVMARGLSRKMDSRVGNFGMDLIRSCVYILLPLSLIVALILVSQGVVQTFHDNAFALTLEGQTQTIPLGPAASQVAIKQLGTNGGGFFGTNSAHPFENPTPFSNFIQVLLILLLPVSQVFAFGKLLSRPREGHALLGTMFLIFLPLLFVGLWSEHSFGTLEGKEMRLGITESVLWGVSTTAASNGSVNAMLSSFSPISGLVFIFQMLAGEVIFGGVGSGLYGIGLYAIITLFLAGLMVGRSPEWLGKKIEAYEVRLALIALLVPCAFILIGLCVALIMPWGLTSLTHAGPHGLSEMLYGFASTVGNNGSAFGSLNANTKMLNVIFGICMIVGRFVVIIPVVLIAGSLSGKKSIPPSSGTFPTDSWLFVTLLAGVILIFGALTFFPVLALGPIAEHFIMLRGF